MIGLFKDLPIDIIRNIAYYMDVTDFEFHCSYYSNDDKNNHIDDLYIWNNFLMRDFGAVGHTDVGSARAQWHQYANDPVNKADEHGMTALHGAVLDLVKDARKIAPIQKLLQNPALLVNKTNYRGETPLFTPARFGHMPALNLILAHPRINVNIKGSQGQAALYCAAFCGRVAVVKVLLAQPGIKLDPKDIEGKTPLDAARNRREHIAKILREMQQRGRPTDFIEQNSYDSDVEFYQEHIADLTTIITVLETAAQARLCTTKVFLPSESSASTSEERVSASPAPTNSNQQTL
jgi:hypothetical protein